MRDGDVLERMSVSEKGLRVDDILSSFDGANFSADVVTVLAKTLELAVVVATKDCGGAEEYMDEIFKQMKKQLVSSYNDDRKFLEARLKRAAADHEED